MDAHPEFLDLVTVDHQDGMLLTAERLHQDRGTWRIRLFQGNRQLGLRVPYTMDQDMNMDLASLCADIRTWFQALDLTAIQQISEQIVPALMRHGMTGIYTLHFERSPRSLEVTNIVNGNSWAMPIQVPASMLDLLAPELDALWAIDGTRSSVDDTSSAARPNTRFFRLDLPATHHAYVHAMSRLRAEIRDISLSDSAA